MLPDANTVEHEPALLRHEIAEFAAIQAVGWPFTTLILVALSFCVGAPLGPYHLWVALALFLVCGIKFAGSPRAWIIAAVSLTLCTIAGGAALGWLYDFSGDGQWYHLPGILALARGWNPFHVSRLAEWNAGFAQTIASSDINYPSYVYVQHYPKGAWIVAAAAYRATGLLEATKVFNLLYVLAVYLFAAVFFSRLGLSRLWSHILAGAVAANPVALYQMASFFIDGQLACLCALVLLGSLDYFRQRRLRTLFLLGACVVLLVDVKFTGAVFAVSLIAGLGALSWIRVGWKATAPYAITGAVAALLAVVVTGYQPYVTNLLEHGHPFYPALAREDGRNVQWHSAPAEFMAMNPVEKLGRSLFASSAGAEEMPSWKLPFAVSKNELYIFFNNEPRYGGFGPLFGSTLALSILVFALSKKATQHEVWKVGAVIAALTTASALLNPEAWWARLSPQLWLVPVILMGALALGATAWPRRAAAVVVLLLLGNSALVAALNLGRAVEKNLLFREQIAELLTMASRGPLDIAIHPSFRMVTEGRLAARSIPYRLVPKPQCATPFSFSYPASAQAAACSSP